MMGERKDMTMVGQDKYDALVKRWERVETLFDVAETNKYMSLNEVLLMLGYNRGEIKDEFSEVQ